MKTFWLRRKKSPTSHAIMKRDGSHVEFWCGQEADDAELLLPTGQTRQCSRCRDYLKHLKTHPPQTPLKNRGRRMLDMPFR